MNEKKYIDELRKKCAMRKNNGKMSESDVKAIYLLWDDPDISKTRLEIEIHHRIRTMEKVYSLADEYIKKNGLNENSYKEIAEIFNNR